MPKYSITIPTDVVSAVKQELGEDADGKTDRAAVVLCLQRLLGPLTKNYRRRELADPTDLEAARVTAEKALANEIVARKTAEDDGDAQAVVDAQGVV